jgi:hypothetical protein
MSMTSKERVYKFRRLNPEKWRAYDSAYKKARRAQGILCPSESPERSKARVYASRALRKFKANMSSSVASFVRRTAREKGHSFVDALQDYFLSPRRAALKARQEKEVQQS